MSGVHSEELLLLSYLDGELDATRAAEVRQHLDICEECRNYLTTARASLRFHHDSVRAILPAPPRPWPELGQRFNDLDAERRQLRSSRPSYQPFWWAAAAAVIAIAVITMRLTTGETVSAAELLARASAQETPPVRIQVKMRKRTFIRTAQDVGDAEVAAMFKQANFDWDRPLRAGAFADWRNGLTEKRDNIQVVQNPPIGKGRFYRITTSTPEGGLREVSLTIRAADLHPVEEHFEFRNNERVELTEAELQVEKRPETPSIASGIAPAGVTVDDEIRVVKALHQIGADLGEPIEVRRREKAIEVTVLGASPQRETEIREALLGLPNVITKFEQPSAVRAPAQNSVQATAETPSGSLHSRLLHMMGSAAQVDAFTNTALETSESISARAHALRQLSERFPEPNETVRGIAADHHRELRKAVARLAEILHPLTGDIDPQPASGRADARALLGAAQRADTLLTLALASPNQRDDADEIVARIRRALAELQGSAAGFQP